MPSRKEKQRQNKPQIRGTELRYASQLRRIAKHVGHVINTFPAGDISILPTISTILEKYSDALTDWAKATATRMLVEVNQRDHKAWQNNAREMSKALRDEIRNAPTGEVMRSLLAEQVTLIKSLPLDAAKRVHELTLQGLENSSRASEIAKEIARSGAVSESRANLIARTEVARTASVLTQARSLHVGATHYHWRTSEDSDVRLSHRQMDGKVIAWDSTPHLSDGTVTHAGQIYNCRCYPEPILPE